MNFPNFNEFLMSLTPDVMKEITDGINKNGLKNASGSLDDVIKQTLTNSGIISCQMTLEILRRYHEFIAQHLQ